MNNQLGSTFYQSEDVVILAKRLLGKKIVSSVKGIITAGLIVETEAYKAPEDRASHAYGNRRTHRTSTMFEQGGKAYIYRCYGIHHLFNVVTAPEGVAHAILIRAIEPIENVDTMLSRRKMSKVTPNLTNGPGKWTVAMGITVDYNGISLIDKQSPVQIFSYPDITDDKILASPRVGVDYAGECALWPWRFRIKDNIWSGK